MSYATLYVPLTTYEAFRTMTSKMRAGTTLALWEKFGIFYEIDQSITSDTYVCVTEAAKTLCQGHDVIHTDGEGDIPDSTCASLASQMKPEQQAKLASCLEEWDAYTCAEGFLR